MITAQELRIGNWARIAPNIENTANDDYSKVYITANHILEIEKSELLCLGIPLTEEWLIKFGCNMTESFQSYWHYHGIDFMFDKAHDRILISIGGRMRFIDYVHRFQNIMALAGEELTCKI